MLKLGRRASGHFVILNEIYVHLIRGISGHICIFLVQRKNTVNSRFSHDVTTAMLVPLNKEKAAMLVPRPNPPEIQLYYYANASFFFSLKNMAVDHVSENQQLTHMQNTQKQFSL